MMPNDDSGPFEIIRGPWLYSGDLGRLTDRAMDMAVTAGVPFTAKYNYSRLEKEGETEITLNFVVYAPEVTIINIGKSDEDRELNSIVSYDSSGYEGSLVLKDLDTGEKFFEYSRGGSSAYMEHGIYFIFPATKSRHFALVHELPNEGKEGKDSIVVWDIPEVTIAANAPLWKNSPEGIAERQAQERIKNFTSNGSNAIITHRTNIWPDRVYPVNSLAVISPGEIVTITGGEIGGSYPVKYKDFEGWISARHLKQ
jgi:hypothetical protein